METNCSKCNHSIFDHSDDVGCDAKGCSCSSGFEESVEDLLNRWEMKILRLETERDNEHDNALEWAAEWITGAQLLGCSEEIQEYARNMAMSIRAAKRGLTMRGADCSHEWDTDETGVFCVRCYERKD